MSAETRIRYGDFRRETSIRTVTVDYSKLTRLKARGAAADERRIRLGGRDLWRILSPYVGHRAEEQIKAVAPLALYLAAFQILILRQHVAEPWAILAGMIATILGLMLFMEGLAVGLMPFGESIGNTLPRRSGLPTVLGIAFALGIGVTYAEPAIGALKAAGTAVRPDAAPYLWALLNPWSEMLVLMVALGVGLAAVVGMLMFVRGWSLKPVFTLAALPPLGLTVAAMLNPDLAQVISLAWDCGGVTTGPVTVPLVLAMSVGVAAAAGRGESSTAGFGIVTLASLLPVATVLLLAGYVWLTTSPAEIAAMAAAAGNAAAEKTWHDASPWKEIVHGLRAIVPLVIFLMLVARFVARAQIEDRLVIGYGLVLCLVGMILFNLGITFGLGALGAQSGGIVPAAFTPTEAVPASPIYDYALGLVVALLFAWVLGFGATLAEPALHALGMTVETLTNGAFRKSTLIWTVSAGVACGVALGIAKLVFDLPLAWMLLAGYAVALAMTWAVGEEFVAVAWDAAAVTTGEVTVPLVLAMGLAFGSAVDAVDGFGILALASLTPILAVLAMGIWIERRNRALEPAQVSGMLD